MAPTRIYVVRDTHSCNETLVRAPSAAQALRYITADQFEVSVAIQSQLVTLLTGGAQVEEASSQAQVPEAAEEHEEQS